MRKIKSIVKKIAGKYVDTYSLSTTISIDDIPKIVDVLNASDIEANDFHLSNSLEQPDHFFRGFSTIKDLYTYPLDDVYVEKFGMGCTCNDIKFDLTFALAENQVITITKGNINLEPLLIQIEESCKKG